MWNSRETQNKSGQFRERQGDQCGTEQGKVNIGRTFFGIWTNLDFILQASSFQITVLSQGLLGNKSFQVSNLFRLPLNISFMIKRFKTSDTGSKPVKGFLFLFLFLPLRIMRTDLHFKKSFIRSSVEVEGAQSQILRKIWLPRWKIWRACFKTAAGRLETSHCDSKLVVSATILHLPGVND